MKKINPIPEGFHSLTPYLIVDNGAAAIEFYKKAFNAVQLMRFDMPDGKIAHAEMKIGNSPLMLGDECPEMNNRSPKAFGGSPMSLVLYVENADGVFNQAVSLGAKALKPMTDQFYGDRSGCIIDPFGHMWTISTHIEEVSEEEVLKRMAHCKKENV